MKTMMKKNMMLNMISSSLIELPTPSSINTLWSLGSMLGIMLSSQILTWIFLTMHYTADISIAFQSIININYNINNGWMMKALHANGASLFFVLLFSHTLRNIFFSSFYLMKTWMMGVSILLLSILTAFLGYVLPWGQMSFWGATVITNLLSAIPIMGTMIVEWIWGGFSVDNPTLTRFYTFHFIFPFIILMMVISHLIFLHESGSSNPVGIPSNSDKIPFHPFFSTKDIIGFLVLFMMLFSVSLLQPDLLTDPENFMKANPLSTPVHIQPEWYFLFAYSILRSIPNKLGGVMALAMAILILYTFPMLSKISWQGLKFNPITKMMFFLLLFNIIMLTWLGMKPVDHPFYLMAELATPTYFTLMTLMPYMK